MKYYKVHNCKQKIEDREILMFIYEAYLKESKTTCAFFVKIYVYFNMITIPSDTNKEINIRYHIQNYTTY